MKKLLLLCAVFLSASNSFAEEKCTIYYKGSSEIKSLIEQDGFKMDTAKYNKLCKELKKNHAGLSLTTMTQISPYQTTASLSISLYSIDSNYDAMTYMTSDWMGYDQERTSQAAKNKVFSLTMNALENLATDDNLRNRLIQNLKEIRKDTKYVS